MQTRTCDGCKFSTYSFAIHKKFIYLKHPVQVPQWDAPRWLPRSIYSLKLPPRSQIMSSLSINSKFSTPVVKSFYPWWYLEKLMAPTEIVYLQHSPRSSGYFCNLALQFPYSESSDGYVISLSLVTQLNWPGFLENFLSSCNLQPSQAKSSMNNRELKWVSLWHRGIPSK